MKEKKDKTKKSVNKVFFVIWAFQRSPEGYLMVLKAVLALLVFVFLRTQSLYPQY